MVRSTVLLSDAEFDEFGLKAVAAGLSAVRESGGEHHLVVSQRRQGDAVCRGACPERVDPMLPVTRGCAVTDNANREWSSSQVRISVSVPSASGWWVKSACHVSLGCSA